MTKELFVVSMKRMANCFGQNFYNTERTEAIWQLCKIHEDDVFYKTCNRLINNSRMPPLPKEIADMARTVASTTGSVTTELALGEYRPKEISKCYDCADSGFIRLTRIDTFEPWAKWQSGSAPCHCGRGELVSKSNYRLYGPQFKEFWEKSYDVNPIYQIAQIESGDKTDEDGNDEIPF